MKKKLIIFSLLISILVFNFSITNVFATIAIDIKVGGEAITYNMNKNEYDTNSAGTVKYEYNATYASYVLKLNNYNGGLIEVNCRSGSPTQTCSKETIFVIEVVGDNYINSDDLAISSNIDVKVVGNGNLTINANSLNSNNIKVNVEESVKLINKADNQKEETNINKEDNKKEETDTTKDDNKKEETDTTKEDNKTDIKEILMILAVVLNIILSATILVILTTKLIKQKK